MSVVRPPRIEPKESGIKICAGGRPDWSANGIRSASAATLFMKAERTAAKTVSAPIIRSGR